MFEIHGWATIRFTPENRERDDEDELQTRATLQVESQVAYYVSTLGWNYNPLVELRRVNGEALVRVDGVCNHAGGVADELQALFRDIAEVAPGSYGLVYTLNNEETAHGSELRFRVYVLARGAFVERSDPFLSPFFPIVETPYYNG